FGARLVVDERARARGGVLLPFPLPILLTRDRRRRQRQQPFAGDALGQRRDVCVVDDLHRVQLPVHVGGDQVVRDRAGVGVGWAVGEARVGAAQLVAAEADRRDAAAAARVPDRLFALLAQLGGCAHAGADDLGVEAACEAA